MLSYSQALTNVYFPASYQSKSMPKNKECDVKINIKYDYLNNVQGKTKNRKTKLIIIIINKIKSTSA